MNPIRFLHIPKTAGTSFTECLRRIYRGEEFRFADNFHREIDRFYNIEPSKRAKILLVSGHAPRFTGVGEIDKLPTVTMLREPVSRVQSFCQHVSEGKSQRLRNQFPLDSFDLDVLLDSGNIELSNFQTRTLLGNHCYELPRKPAQDIVERATEVIDKGLSGFGIVERFDESLILLRHTFCWKPLPLYRRVNQRNQKKRLTFEVRHIEKIHSLNEIDIQLYARAFDIFHRRFDAVSELVTPTLAVFRKHEKYLSVWFAICACLKQLKRRRHAY